MINNMSKNFIRKRSNKLSRIKVRCDENLMHCSMFVH